MDENYESSKFHKLFEKFSVNGKIEKSEMELILKSFGGDLAKILPAELKEYQPTTETGRESKPVEIEYNFPQFELIMQSFQLNQPDIVKEKTEKMTQVLQFFGENGMVNINELVKALKICGESEETINKLFQDAGIQQDEQVDIESLLKHMIHE